MYIYLNIIHLQKCIKSWISKNFDVVIKLIDAIYWDRIDTGCDVIMAAGIQWRHVPHYRISWRPRIIVKRRQE